MTSRWIAPLPDSEIITKITKLIKSYPELTGNFNINGKNINFSELDNTFINKVKSVAGFSIITFTVSYGKYSYTYSTNHNSSTSLVKLDFGYNTNTPTVPNDEIFALDFQKVFPAPPASVEPIAQNELTSGFLKVETALSGAIDRFEELHSSFAKKNQELRDEHETAVSELKSEIENEKTRLQAEISQQRDELAKARKEIDDRSNTHARRAIRNEIKESIVSSLSQSEIKDGSESKRLFLRKAYLCAVFILISFVAVSTLLLSSAIQTNNLTAVWLTGIKLSISSLSAIGMILLYLRWEGQWLHQQANFERVLSSTKVDIDRASWVAESLLEWNRESPSKEIPKELLESFTRRLFDWDAKVEDHHSAQDSLASAILGSAAKIQIGSGGTSVEFDKGGIKKLDKITP